MPERIADANIERIGSFDFVFLAVDDGPARGYIVDWLSAKGIPFVDCGMGLTRSSVGLSGFVRITGTDRKAFEDNIGTARLPAENAKDDEYRKQAQITELNALNAAMAVARFKQHFGFSIVSTKSALTFSIPLCWRSTLQERPDDLFLSSC